MGDETAFYSAVAGLIPVLGLVAAIEVQGIAKRLDDESDKARWADFAIYIALVALFFLAAALAEIEALEALLHGADDESEERVTGALVLLTFILTLGPLFPAFRALEKRAGRKAPVYAVVTWGVVALGTLLIVTLR